PDSGGTAHGRGRWRSSAPTPGPSGGRVTGTCSAARRATYAAPIGSVTDQAGSGAGAWGRVRPSAPDISAVTASPTGTPAGPDRPGQVAVVPGRRRWAGCCPTGR